MGQVPSKRPLKAIVSSMFIMAAVLFFAAHAQAATLSFSTDQGYAVGQTFSVSVLVSTASGESINAVSATISYDPSQLKLVSISKASSVITMWASEPTFSNSAGTADLEGIVLNPGFTGQGGLVATITFKVLSAGQAKLSFSQASVLANDGLGTNVLTSAPAKSVYLGAAAAPDVTTEAIPSGAPSAPVITSSTNPDPAKWYATSSPSFAWTVPADVTAVRLEYDSSPVSVPAVVYSPAISSKTLSKLPDGVYYFHAQFKNANGWGAIAHFKFSIDTVPPLAFQIVEPHPEYSTDPRPILLFNTVDSLSGVDHYDVKVGNDEFQTIDAAKVSSNPYTPPTQMPGEKTILVKAYDKAGNVSTQSTTINIQSIEPPVIDSYQSEIQQGDLLRIQGHTYPNSTVTITVKDSSGVKISDTAKSTAAGNFVITWAHQLGVGTYTFIATVTNDKDATSLPSDSNTVVVGEKVIYRVGFLVINYFSIAMFCVVAVAALVWAIMYAWHRLNKFRRKIRKSVSETEHTIHRRFEEMECRMNDHMATLESAKDKRQLTREEKAILNSFRKYMGETEKDIDTKLEQIRKDAK